MNEGRLKFLIEYLKILSEVPGKYHEEIKVAIAAIENELGIKTKEQRNKILGK